ncbi:hypothetical protein QCA50_004556 [Cerrena zonata]|uniref:Uncharacterized protein n=1 Tax=Cerrena zonata TaxID=2478898 RepID=A0AAW0GHV3_9APHY
MLSLLCISALLLIQGLFSAATPTPPLPKSAIVNLRIEGLLRTIFEGPIHTRGHNVTTASGGTHHCDGTNNNESPISGPTCTTALDDASRRGDFTWDGTFFDEFDDYFITRIAENTGDSDVAWGILLGFQFTPVGGCQQEVKQGDEVLWAFDAFNKQYFLKLDGPAVVKAGIPATFTVIDGATGDPIQGATVAGNGHSGVTDVSGKAQLVFQARGPRFLKAERSDSIRSNRFSFLVVP